jgi:hypothetical protein
VQLTDLVARKDLNGSVAVIVAPIDADEARDLAEKGRVKVSGEPRPFSVEYKNLVLIDDSPPTPLPFKSIMRKLSRHGSGFLPVSSCFGDARNSSKIFVSEHYDSDRATVVDGWSG